MSLNKETNQPTNICDPQLYIHINHYILVLGLIVFYTMLENDLVFFILLFFFYQFNIIIQNVLYITFFNNLLKFKLFLIKLALQRLQLMIIFVIYIYIYISIT